MRAQTVRVDTIRAVQPWPPNEQFTFPHVDLREDPGVAQRINRDLCLDFLYVDPGTTTGSIFQEVWGDPANGIPPSLHYFSWSWDRPLPQVLSIGLSGEACRAYCEPFSIHYVYDLRTGERLRYDVLFTGEGCLAVDGILMARWRAAVGGQIRQLEDSLRQTDISNEDRDRWQEALEMYRECLLERTDQPPPVDDVEVRSDHLRVWKSRCSNHALRSLDDLW